MRVQDMDREIRVGFGEFVKKLRGVGIVDGVPEGEGLGFNCVGDIGGSLQAGLMRKGNKWMVVGSEDYFLHLPRRGGAEVGSYFWLEVSS